MDVEDRRTCTTLTLRDRRRESVSPKPPPKATAELIEEHLHLIDQVVPKYLGKGLDREDLWQEGWIGLATAAGRYDEERGRFAFYAIWWIRERMFKATYASGRLIRLPEYLGKRISKYRRVRSLFIAESGREPSVAELCRRLGWSAARLDQVVEADRQILFMPHGEDVEDRRQAPVEVQEQVQALLARLDRLRRSILTKTFGLEGEPLSLRQVSEATRLPVWCVKIHLTSSLRWLAESEVE